MKKCDHCGDEGDFKWHPTLCSNGRKRQTKYLCMTCDIELNYYVLKFFNDPEAEEKIKAYKNSIQ